MKRNAKLGMISIAFTLTFIAVVILVNIVLSLVAEKLPLRLDVTENSILSLSDETKAILNEIDTDIELIVTDNRENALALTSPVGGRKLGAEMVGILERYVQQSPNITIRYVDPLKEPGVIKNYIGDTPFDELSVIVHSGKRFKIVPRSTLYVDQQDNESMLFVAEKELTSAILFTHLDSISSVGFVTGHNELSSADEYLSSLTTLLAFNSYDFRDINMQVEEIPADTTILFIISPMVDFSDSEIAALDKHVKAGGHVFLVLSPECPELPNLERYAAEFGIVAERDLLVDNDAFLAAYQTPVATTGTYADNEFVQNFHLGNRLVAVPIARTLTKAFETKGTRMVTPLLVSSKTSFTLPYDEALLSAGQTYAKTADSKAGPLPLALLCTDTSGKENTYFLVLSAFDFFDPVFMDNLSLANNDLCSSVIASMSGEFPYTIAPKTIYYTPMLLDGQQGTIMWILCLVPILFIIFGIFVYFRRRNR